MLIGIDMIAVQSSGGGDREIGRYGRQLVRALLARDPAHRYVLYFHEGLPAGSVPSGPNVRRAPLVPASGRPHARRSATQRLLDRDPDGLDWLILLDPFAEAYGGLPPESPLNGPRVASVVHDFAQGLDIDRRLVPIRRHDLVLAASEEVASAYRSLMGLNGHRVSTIGLASDEPFAPPDSFEPLTRHTGSELGGLGIRGPYLMTRMSGRPSRAEMTATLDGYRRLPVEHRRGFQLVVDGVVGDPTPVRSFLREHGADPGLVLLGEVSEPVLASLYGRCSAFLAPAARGGSSLALVEALKCGAPILGTASPTRSEIVGDAGWLIDSPDPSDLASAVEALLGDDRLAAGLRRRALARSARFSIEAAAEAVVSTLEASSPPASPRFRIDRGHGARPRVAAFLDDVPDSSGGLDLAARWLDSHAIDLYLEPGLSMMADRFPAEVGGFDARLFDRNDGLLGYHSVVHFLGDVRGLDRRMALLARRPGLVVLGDDSRLDRLGSASSRGTDHDLSRLRALLMTGSRLAVRSPRLLERIAGCLPEFADQLSAIPPVEAVSPTSEALRARTRSQLDLLPRSIVIGLFGRWGDSIKPRRLSRAFGSAAKAIPEAIFLSFDSGSPVDGDRFLTAGPVSPEEADQLVPALDLALFLGDSDSVTLPGLLRGGVPTMAFDGGLPDVDSLCRRVVEVAPDPEARSGLFRSASSDEFGTPDPSRASKVLLEQVELCAAELRRGPRRRRLVGEGPRGLIHNPHFALAASAKVEAASRSR